MGESLTMSVAEAAQQLGISTKSCYNLTHRADFPTVKLGRRTRINREALREWVQQQTQTKNQ